MNNCIHKYLIFAVFVLFANVLFGQDSTDSKRVIPGENYEAGSLHEFFLGEHWRNLWTTEFEAEVLDLDKFAGGLTPTKKGGGQQTLSLRFQGADGKEYKFRTIDKAPKNSLPPELRESIYGDILQDQVTIGTPVSSVIVPPLLNAVGVLNSVPQIVLLPDTDKLGEFKNTFGGKLGTIEINPKDYDDKNKSFAGADKIINGFEIFEETEGDNDERVDQAEFLKARLMDVWLGDRDRHADQWKWAGYKDEETKVRSWKPIPRDRDYAFCRYDGLLPWVSGFVAHSLVGFNEDYPSLLELTWSGRHLDRRFLNELSKSQWDSIALYLKSQLDDNVIRDALIQMPPEMYSKAGDVLFNELKARRDKLLIAADEYYNVYSDVVDIYGSDKREYVEINRMENGHVKIELYKRDKDSGEKKGSPFYSRVFDNEHTSEIRLHTLGGDDKVTLSGTTDESIFIRVITEKGDDEVIDNSRVNGSWLGFTPFSDASMMTKVYDRSNKTKIKEGPGTEVVIEKIETPKRDIERYEPFIENRYGFWAVTPVLEYNSDDGFILGGGPNYTQFGFRAEPYLYYLQLTGSYSTTSKDYDFIFLGEFTKFLNNKVLQIIARASQLEFNRFYGEGNETTRSDSLREAGYYTVSRQLIYLRPTVKIKLNKDTKLDLYTGYEYTDVINKPNTIISDLMPYGIGKKSLLNAGTGITFDSRDNIIYTKRGIFFNTRGEYYPVVFDNKNDFSILNGDIRAYFTTKTFTEFTFALRLSGEKVFGTYPFYKSAKLGGAFDLRGYPNVRYSGDAKILSTAEVRFPIGMINLFIPGKLGLMVFTDVGRVFYKGDDSEKWHSSFGGGIWLNLLDAISLNFSAGRSSDYTKFYFKTGFTF